MRAFKWPNTANQERDWQMESLNTDFPLDPRVLTHGSPNWYAE